MVKRILLLLCLLIVSAVSVKATDVAVAASQVPYAQISGLPGDVTGLATVTNGSATITLTSNFRTQWIGLSGFIINLPAGDYYVVSVASGGVITLHMAYTGSSSSGVSYRVYPFIYLQFYASMPYTPNGQSYVVQAGAPGSAQFFKRVAVTVRTNTLYLPALTLDATTDAVNPAERAARLSAYFYKQDNSQIGPYGCFESFQVRPETPSSWTAICAYNQSGTVAPPDNRYYTTTQIDSFLPVCTAGQMAYYQATGRQMNCLTVGSGLNITAGVITSSGGGGGSGVWSSLTAPAANLTMSHGAFTTSFQWSNNTGSNDLFTLATGANDAGMNYLLNVATPGGGNNKKPFRVQARGADTLAVSADGKVGFNQASPVAQVDVVPDSIGTVGVKVNAPSGSTTGLLQLHINGTVWTRFMPNASGTVDAVLGASLLTTATGGFPYIPVMAGQPTGFPSGYAGTVPIVYDSTNNKLWAFESPAWVDLTGSGGGGSAAWSGLTDPTGSLSLSMAATTTTFTWNSVTGATDLFTLRNGSGDTGTGPLLRVQAFGSKQPLLVQADSTNALRIDQGGSIVVGPIASGTAITSGTLYATAAGNVTQTLYQADAAPELDFYRTEGTLNAPSQVTNGAELGRIAFYGRDPSATISGNALILADVDGAPSAGIVPTRLTIGNSELGNPWITLRYSGLVGIRTATPAGQLHVLAQAASVIPLIAEQPASPSVDIFQGRVNGSTKFKFSPDATGNVFDYVFGDQVLSTSATRGFVYIPTVTAGAPVGTPSTYSGVAPLVLRNQTGNTKIYAYLDGNWVDLTGGGGGSSVWSALTNPVADLSLSMAGNQTSFVWGATTSTDNLFTLSNGSDDTGTNYLVSIETPGTVNAKSPFRIQANGSNSLVVSPEGYASFGTATPAARATVAHGASSSGTYLPAVRGTLTVSGTTDLSAGGAIAGITASIVDTQTGAGIRGFAAGVTGRYVRNSGADTTIGNSAGVATEIAVNESDADIVYGAFLTGPVVASGKTLTSYIGVNLTAPSGAGTTTTSQAIVTAAGAGMSGFGVTPTLAMVQVLSNAAGTRGMYVNTAASPSSDAATFANDGTSWVRLSPGTGTDTASASVKTINSVFGTVALNEDTTNGFIYLPTVDTAPTGTPTAFTGTVAFVYDTGDNRLYAYNGGWVNLTSGGGGGSTVWSDLTNPTGNLSLSMGANTTTFTSNATTSTGNIWTFTNTSNDTGTNYLFSIATPGGSNAKAPFRIAARGLDTMVVDAEGDVAFGGTATTGFLNVTQAYTTTTVRDAERVLVQTGGADISLGFTETSGVYARFTEARTGASSAGGFNQAGFFEFIKNSGTTAALSNSAAIATRQVINESITGATYNMYLVSPTVASGKTVGTMVGIYMEGLAIVGTVTNRHAMVVEPNAGNIIVGATAGTTAAKFYSRSQSAVAAGVFDVGSTGDALQIQSSMTSIVRFVPGGSTINSVFGTAALANNATNGFLYLPVTTSDAPSGTPTSFTGTAAVVIENDTTNSQYNLYGYVNGAWRNLTGTGGGGSVWSSLTNPSGNLSLAHANNTTTFTWNNTSGSSNLFTITNTSNNAGTGYLTSIETPGGSNASQAFRVRSRGVNSIDVQTTGAVWFGAPTGGLGEGTAQVAIRGTDDAGVSLLTSLFVTNEAAAGPQTIGQFLWQTNSLTAFAYPVIDVALTATAYTAGLGPAISFTGIESTGPTTTEWAKIGALSYNVDQPVYVVQVKSSDSSATLQTRNAIHSEITLTDATNTDLFFVSPLSTGNAIGGSTDVTVICKNASAVQVYTAVIRWSAYNQSGTAVAPTPTTISSGTDASSGTLTCTYNTTVSGSTQVIYRINCDTSLTSLTDFKAFINVRNNSKVTLGN